MNVNGLVSLLSLLYGYYYQTGKDTGKQEVKHHHWSYEGDTGPNHWQQNYPKCGGSRQSPIDIMTSEVEPVTWLTPFEFVGYDKISGYNTKPFLRLRNNGHTASMAVKEEMYIRGANLGDIYRTAEIHFHWGPNINLGSEHGLNHRHHPLEIHFVHYNTRYGNLSTAMKHPDGLAVIGVFADVSKQDNLAFEHISESIGKIVEYNSTKEVIGIRAMDILPQNTDRYFHYEGSLTTPPCYESVLWFVMEDTIKISEKQLQRFRHLKEHVKDKHKPNGKLSGHGNEENNNVKSRHGSQNQFSSPGKPKYIHANYRPVQSLLKRPVFCSNPSMKTIVEPNMSAKVNTASATKSQVPDVSQNVIMQRSPQQSATKELTKSGIINGNNLKSPTKGITSSAQDKNLKTILPKMSDLGSSLNDHSSSANGNGKISADKQISNNNATKTLKISFTNQDNKQQNGERKSGSATTGFATDGEMFTDQLERGKGQEIGIETNVVSTPEYRKYEKQYTYKSKRRKELSDVDKLTNSYSLLPDSAMYGTKDGLRKAQLLKTFAAIFLKQADILQRMQQNNYNKEKSASTLFNVQPNFQDPLIKEYSNPSTNFGTIESGFATSPAANYRYNTPNIDQLLRPQIAAFESPDSVAVEIETPSWTSSLPRFSPGPHDVIQRQHLTYYDPLDTPIGHRSIISPPSPKYNVVKSVPRWPLSLAPTRKINRISTPHLDAFMAKNPKPTSKTKKRTRRGEGKKSNKRRWMIDLLSDYTKLVKVLQLK